MQRTLFNQWGINKNSACKTISLALLFFLVFPPGVFAQMSSTQYKIPSDTINIGGQESSSTNYKEIDTIGQTSSGPSASSTYKINAGFLAAESIYLSISAGADITMSPSISGISGGTGTGSTYWTVITDNPAGYQLYAHSTTNPALASLTSSFANYTPTGSDPDYNWSISSTDSEFGFTPEGPDIYSRFKDNGSACNTGSSDTADKCWDNLTTSNKAIAERTSGNHPSGTTTTVKVQAEVGSNHIQPNGNYQTTIEVTLLPL